MIHKYLAYLKTIETGSITQAAAELGYTQSAVSRMIADLEEHWDVPLLTRNRSGIEISSEGTQLLPILQSIVKGQEELSFAVGRSCTAAERPHSRGRVYQHGDRAGCR